MILPIVTAITREVFRQTPRSHIEAAQALGATQWEVVRMTVLPFGRSGTIAAAMLGLGRALGETVAVLIILRTASDAVERSACSTAATPSPRRSPPRPRSSASPLPTGAYIAAGFVLFVLTFIVNAVARAVAGGKVNGMSTTTGTDTGTGKTCPAAGSRPSSRSAGRAGPRTQSRRSWSRCASRSRLVPLLWVLSNVIVKGVGAVVSADMVDQVAAGDPARAVRRRGLPRHLRHARPGVHRRDHRRPARH